MALHDAAIKDEYFVKRKLAPNVDFWYVLFPTLLFQGCSYPILGGKLIIVLRLEE
jgi:citrate synthase